MESKQDLGPATDLRRIEDIRTGFFTTNERIERFGKDHEDAPRFKRHWDLIKHRKQMMCMDSAFFKIDDHEALPSAVRRMGDHPLIIADGVTIDPWVVIDTQEGAVVIESGVHVGSFSVIKGPCFLGEHTQLAAHTRLRGGVAVGPWCKVGGEIGATIFQSYSNKGHDGYVGDSWVGSWVNLGAMTTTSNLKNTYGEIRYKGESTGLQFLGSIIGDYCKTAIGTRLNTGSLIGTGSMLAISGILPREIPAFTWLTDESLVSDDQRLRCYQLNQFIEAADRMMKRRGEALDDETLAKLSVLHHRNWAAYC